MQRDKDDDRPPHRSSDTQKVLAGDVVHPYYYLAVLCYIINKMPRDPQMVNEFFNDLKQIFLEFDKKDHPPPDPSKNLARAKWPFSSSQIIVWLEPVFLGAIVNIAGKLM